MSNHTRRDFLKTTGGIAARRAAGRIAARRAKRQRQRLPKPETGAKLRVLRWKRFVQGDEDQWLANTKKFTEADRRRSHASTARTGRTSARRRRWPPTSAAAPTSSSARTTTRICIRTSCST